MLLKNLFAPKTLPIGTNKIFGCLYDFRFNWFNAQTVEESRAACDTHD